MSWQWKRGPLSLACRRCQYALGTNRNGYYPRAVYDLVRTGRTKPLGKRAFGRQNRPSAGQFHEMRCSRGHVFWTLHDQAPKMPLDPRVTP